MMHQATFGFRGQIFSWESLVVLLAVALGYFASLAPAAPTSQPDSPSPDPKLKPADVVRIVVEALGSNDDNDNGIRTTWKFASPANQQVTGPVERFIPMVKSAAFAPMLSHAAVVYSTPEVKDDQAVQLVVLTGTDGVKTMYIFQLSRQADGKLKGCWMTDGVIPIKPPADQPGNATPV